MWIRLVSRKRRLVPLCAQMKDFYHRRLAQFQRRKNKASGSRVLGKLRLTEALNPFESCLYEMFSNLRSLVSGDKTSQVSQITKVDCITVSAHIKKITFIGGQQTVERKLKGESGVFCTSGNKTQPGSEPSTFAMLVGAPLSSPLRLFTPIWSSSVRVTPAVCQ